jgi:Ca-activated chloride channel family protein
MKRRLGRQQIVTLSAVFILSLSLESGRASDYTIRSEVRLVLLDVSVKDSDGFVSGLAADDFSVFEDRQRQAIRAFSSGDLPINVGILVDESSSMRAKRSDVLAAAETFIRKSNPQDQMFVLNFNERVRRGLPDQVLFSGSVEQLSAALERGVPEGRTALNDAVIDGLEQLQLGRRERKALVVISDGGDNASLHSRRQMSDMVERSAATVYTIGLYDADDLERNPGVLKELATISGGLAYFPHDSSAMISMCERIANDLRSRYTIGYTPPPNTEPGKLRHIRVEVSTPGHGKLAVNTRRRYRYK